MEGLGLAPEDASDTIAFVGGTITLDEYGRRIRARFGVPDTQQRGTVPGSGQRPL